MSSLVPTLPTPLNTIFIEMRPGDHKDFGAASDYPLKGVTFVTEYGYLPGYTGEDGAPILISLSDRSWMACAGRLRFTDRN